MNHGLEGKIIVCHYFYYSEEWIALKEVLAVTG